MTVNGDPTKAASYSGSGYGAVINQGSISVSNGGFAILAAPYVQNTGFIKADLGTIALAGTNQFTLDLSGTGLINFVVPAGAVEKIVSDGKAVGVDNAGTLQARSGQLLISANVASEVVNAVVNLNGIVDADAFAANGQGGSVLVTAAGDVNVGGQVTARGNGTGNGGQIVTKAGSNDAIGQLAFVSATGGASGSKGGNIEVSGKTVGLNGAIDPGKGGLLYVDPSQFTIRNGTSGQNATGIGEHKLEALLQNGAGFLVNVAHNITIQDLSDNVLAGGPGDLTLHAGTAGTGAIIVQGVGDTIRTGGGDVTLTAAGNIGDSSHALSFVSGGANLSGVSQAGDIVLTATNGGNIYVNSVTERAAGPGTRHALFSANAAGLFTAEGLIDLEVRANGVGTQSADAEVHIAANQIRLAGITALANATKHASSGSNAGGSAFANAIVTLNGKQASDDGAMTVVASVAGSSGFRFHANAQLIVNEQTGFFMKGGPISVMARANAFSAGTSGVLDNAVLADAGLKVNGSGAVEIDSLGVHATALGDKVANDVASAHADLNGTDINIFGDATVTANGQGGPSGAALVVAQASMNVTGNDAVDISSNVTVTAEANNPGLGRGASATADLRLVANSQTVTVGGNITVNALALNGGSSFAAANAILNVTGDQGVAIDGDVSVIANGQTLAEAGTDLATPRATASANVFSRNGDIHIGGNLDVEASADDQNLDSVRGHARAHIVASGSDFQSISIDGFTKVTANAKTNAQNVFNSGSPHGASATASLMIHSEGHVFLGNDVTVKASASDLGRFQAFALANVSITATATTGEFGVPLPAGSISILGNVDVEATAHDPVGNGALANAQFFAKAHSGVQIGFAGSDGSPAVEGNLTVAALADNGGLGNASAIGVASVIGKFGPVGVLGDVSVTANAHDAGGGNAFASAFANFSGSGSEGRPGVEIGGATFSGGSFGGHVDVKANAVEDDGAAAIAVAGASFDAGSSQSGGGVAIHNGVNVVADANNDGTEASHMAASASAHLNFFAREVDVNGAMSITAHATNSGFGQVNAHGAVAFSSARTINLGDVTIDVKALNLSSRGSGGAKASANFIETNSSVSLTLDSLNLQAQASSHGGGNAIANAIARITQSSLSIAGDVTINALAFRSDPPVPSGSANALASLDLRASTNDLFIGGNVRVTANAVDQGNGLAQANAHALLASDTTVHVAGSILVSALASAQGKAGGTAANANAQLIFEDASNIVVGGDMSIIAHGTNHGQGKVLASGRVDFGSSATTVNLTNVLIDVRALNLGTGGTGGAKANALFSASTDIKLTIESLNLQAQASSFGPGNAHALASVNIAQSDLTIGGDVTVNALAVAHGGGNALAQANLLLTATSGGDLTVSGDIDVHANANAFGAGQAQANAIASVTGGSSSSGFVNLGGVNVIANALHSGAGAAALALAQLTIDPSTITISDDVNVEASANNLNGFAGGLAASAKGVFNVSASSAITIGGDVTVLAHATNHGKGRVLAQGSVNISSASMINLAGVTIDVAALNIGTGANAGTGGAIANAIFNAGSSANLSLGALNLQAQASSFGPGNAHALASANITQSSLTIGGDVTVNALAVAHGGGNALAQANLLLRATSGGDINVSGDIDVHANANGFGAGQAQANAIASLTAGSSSGLVKLGGVNVIANALHSGAGAGALALAELTIDPGTVTISSDVNVEASANNLNGFAGGLAASANAVFNVSASNLITITGDVTALAHATNHGKGRVLAKGSVNVSTASTINLAGVTIDVAALNIGTGANAGTGGAIANAIFHAGSSHNLSLGALNLQAQASSLGGGNALALASGNITQSHVVIDGDVTVNALAVSHGGAGNAVAVANLLLTATSGSLSVSGDIDVHANANAAAAGEAQANAIALLNASSSEGGGADIHIDNINVIANALHSGTGGPALALAQLTVNPHGSDASISGAVNVKASANNLGGRTGAIAASANALFSIPSAQSIHISSDISVVAHATNNGKGRVLAQGNIQFDSSASTINLAGVTIDVAALNIGSQGTGGAIANAIFLVNGSSVNLHIDALNLQAQANSAGVGNAIALASGKLNDSRLQMSGALTVNAAAFAQNGNAQASAIASLAATTGPISLDSVHVSASAVDNGNGAAKALAEMTFDPSSVHVTGDLIVHANASHNGAASPGGLGASANANLNFLNTAKIEVDGLMSIAAHATNNGAGRVNAFGNVNFSTATSIDLQDVVIDVRARNLGSGVSGAKAIATFTPAGAATVTINSLNLQAQATSHGTGNAFASANGQLIQGTLSIPGDIIVNAVAVSDAGNASALANLRLSASTGSLNLGGNVRVLANASGNGGDVLANALTFLQAQDGVTIGGNIEADASANGGSQADGNVWAVTDLRVDALSGSISIGGNVDMHGNAQHPDGADGGAGVFAYGAITADDGVRVNGNISVTAELKSNAINTGATSIGAPFAPDKLTLGFDFAGLLVHSLATGDVSIGGGVEVVANAEFDNPALDANVFARGSAIIEAQSGDVAIVGPVFVQGNAKSAGNASGTVFGSAKAHIDVLGDSGSIHVGDVTVKATASATGANAGQQACAFGDMEISAGGTSGDVSAGLLSERVEAVYLGSHANDAFASANMFVTAACRQHPYPGRPDACRRRCPRVQGATPPPRPRCACRRAAALVSARAGCSTMPMPSRQMAVTRTPMRSSP